VLRPETVGLLICPACGAADLQAQVFGFGEEGSIASGVLHCRSCRQWFPVEEGILELLSGGLAYAEDRSRFWKAHEEGLRQLGLVPDAPRDAGQTDGAVARQQAHFD